ncbi:hypothetical protein K438DRAFT_1554281, partial [Mycena galopus ATCC 62051]
AVQFIPTIVLAIGVCFIPESPRWLMSVGRKHHGNGDADAPLVVLQWGELEASIATVGSDKLW